jgi:hypothetical protein
MDIFDPKSTLAGLYVMAQDMRTLRKAGQDDAGNS